MKWYHNVLCHPGGVRMDCTMRSVYTWLNMREDIYEFCKTCPTCQKCKKSFNNTYGFLPPKEAESTKWSRVNLDCWGPKTVKNVKNGHDYEIRLLTMVDPVIGWFEYAQLYEPPTVRICKELFKSTWLSRYPRPKEIGIDNRSEFQKNLDN